MSKKKLTQKRLKEALHYDSDTGVFVWIVALARRIKTGDVAGFPDCGYIKIGIDGEEYKAHRLAWLYVYGYFPENEIDHKDRIRCHNWIKNLREVSHKCNIRNTGNHKDNKSGVKGVCWAKHAKKWLATIGVDNKLKHLGIYKNFDNAVCARLAAEQCLDWSGCDSSSPAFKYVQSARRY